MRGRGGNGGENTQESKTQNFHPETDGSNASSSALEEDIGGREQNLGVGEGRRGLPYGWEAEPICLPLSPMGEPPGTPEQQGTHRPGRQLRSGAGAWVILRKAAGRRGIRTSHLGVHTQLPLRGGRGQEHAGAEPGSLAPWQVLNLGVSVSLSEKGGSKSFPSQRAALRISRRRRGLPRAGHRSMPHSSASPWAWRRPAGPREAARSRETRVTPAGGPAEELRETEAPRTCFVSPAESVKLPYGP